MKMSRPISIVVTLFVAAFFFGPRDADAQMDRLRRAGKRVQDLAERSVGDRANRLLDNAVYCALGDDACVRNAKDEGKTPVFQDDEGNAITNEDGHPISDPEEAALAVEAPGTGVWRNYDFVAGSIVWYAMDLSNARVGRIPTDQIEFVSGNLQTVELNGRKVLESSQLSVFRIPLPDSLPDRFTVELDWQAEGGSFAVAFFTADENRSSYHHIDLSRRASIINPDGPATSLSGFEIKNEPVHFSIQVDRNAGRDDDYVIGYGGFTRFGQIPNARFGRGNAIEFHMDGNTNIQTWISNIVIAVKPEANLALELMETGTATTRGLLFDFNSARLKPESTPTLTEILGALEENAEMQLAIEGHTDDAGDEDYNQTLSEQRAASVIAYLVGEGVDEGRLEAVGKGESEPVAGNGTEAGRKQNRRVVLRVIE